MTDGVQYVSIYAEKLISGTKSSIMIHRAPEEFEFSLLGKKARDLGPFGVYCDVEFPF